MIDRTVVF